MTEQSKILVTGATGKVGGQVVSQLLDAGANVRALVRDPGYADLPDGVEVARGDLSDPSTLETALDGVESVFLLWAASDDYAPAAVDMISRHARRVVYLSSMGVREDRDEQTDPINQSHANLERLIRNSGIAYTFLRASGFAANTLGWAEQIRKNNIVRAPYGEASRSLIHERDIASVAAHALAENGHDGKIYILTGPEAVKQSEQVRLIGEAIGRPVRWEEQSRAEARPGLAEAFGDESYADGALDAWAAFVEHPERVTNAVEEVTGRSARTFREWAADHADDFRKVAATTEEVASEYVALVREGDFETAMRRLFSENFVRVEQAETFGPPVELRGEEVTRNMERNITEEEIHAFEVDDPFVGGDERRFAVRFSFDSTFRSSGERKEYSKISLYTVEGGKLVREEVYHDAPPLPS